jgi:hypothetical protein
MNRRLFGLFCLWSARRLPAQIMTPAPRRMPSMRLSPILCSVVAISLTVICPGLAQTAKTPAKSDATGIENRYFTGLGDILGDLPVDAFLKETRQDGKIVSTLLDVCYSVSLTSDRKDRFVINLKSDGQKLSGSGETTEDKSPVTVNLTRKPVKNSVTFEGKITIGDKPSLVSSTDNTDSDEKEFQASQTTDDSVSENPADFTDVSPQSLAVKVKRENFVDLLKTLRNDNIQLSLDSLATDCTALRTGAQFVRFTVDPARSGALLGKLKVSPGTISAGWTTGSYDIERSIRLSSADWRDGDKLNKDKLSNAILNSVAKTLSAQPVSAKWNDTTGELTIDVKRPNTTVPALNLVDVLEVTALVGPEKPNASDKIVIWLGTASTTTSDESAGPRLSFSDNSSSDEGESSFSDDDGLVKAVAADLKGQRWDADQAAWK